MCLSGPRRVAEIDQTDEGTLGPVRTEWLGYQILAGGLLLLFLVMIGLSLRDPIEPINVGRPVRRLVDPGRFLADRRRPAARGARGVPARVRTGREVAGEARGVRGGPAEARGRDPAGVVEGRGERPAPCGRRRATRRRATREPPAPAPPAPEPTVVQVPESDVVVTSPLGGAWAAAPAGPLARAARDQKTVPVTSRKKKPAAAKPKRASPKRASEKPAAREAGGPATGGRRSHGPLLSRSRRVPKPAASEPAPAPVAARAPTPARELTRPRQGGDATAHAAALETFIRLTESDRQPHDTTTVDQGAVRAALARTAARKKPGGERLQLPETARGVARRSAGGLGLATTGRSISPGRSPRPPTSTTTTDRNRAPVVERQTTRRRHLRRRPRPAP